MIAQVLGLDYENDGEVILGRQLAGVGLAEIMPYGHLRLHPALGPALDRELSDEERDAALTPLAEAEKRFRKLADADDVDAVGMAMKILTL